MTSYDVRTEGDPSVAVVALTGNVDRDAMQAVNEAYESATAQRASIVLLDFTTVDYINSTGIALIVGVLGRARAEGRSVRATGLSEHYRHIFEITRLSDFIQIYSDVDSAVAGAPTH